MQVYIVRHTQVDVPKEMCYGHLEVPLQKTYLAEFKNLYKQLPKDCDRVYCSSSKRCLNFADYIKMPYEKRSDLRELNFGAWEGKSWQEISPAALHKWAEDFVQLAPPQGESLAALYKRITLFLDDLRQQKHKKVVIITHAGVIRCIMAYVLAIPLKNLFKLKIGFGKVYQLQLHAQAEMDHIIY